MDRPLQTALDIFLRSNRSAALKFTAIRLKDEEAALDVLQEAMIGFSHTVHQYEEEVWKKLFYKILLRRITDFQRKQSWRHRIVQVLNFSQLAQPEDEHVSASLDPEATENTAEVYEAGELADAFEVALGKLPARQQEAYLLRQWQAMSVAETAVVMKCSQGSVKTHLSRAMQALRQELGDWIDPH